MTSSLPSILIVDDDPDNFDVIETLLSDQNYQLHYTSNGTRAIASLDILQPNLILLDVMMPDMDGQQVCRAKSIREKLRRIRENIRKEKEKEMEVNKDRKSVV